VEAADTFRQNLLQLTPDQRMRVERYTVRKGDTVASIAQRFGTLPNVIRELNGMEPADKIEVDSELRIPSSVTTLPPKVLRAAALVDGGGKLRRLRGREVHVVKRGDSLYAISRRTGVDVKTLASLNGLGVNAKLRAGQRLSLGGTAAAEQATARKTGSKAASSAAAGAGRQVTYVVRRGDTLSSIARTLQVSVANLLDWNDLATRQAIRPGQKLVAYVRKGG
jgi:membrane-bound lytic murein transglycosylase D